MLFGHYWRLTRRLFIGIGVQLALMVALLLLVQGGNGVVHGVLLWLLCGSLSVSVFLLWTALRERTLELTKELTRSVSILNGSADGITILTPDGLISSFSRGAEIITGYRSDEVLGRPCCDIFKHSSQNYEELCATQLCALCQATMTGESAAGKELYLVHKNGSHVPILLSVSPIKDEHGQVIEVLQIFKDMSEIKSNLLALEQASRSKSEFLATMSHELRTPLNAVLGFAELLDAQSFGELNERQRRFVGNIMTAGKDLLTLINDILDLSRIEAGRMEWERETVDLRQ